MIPKPNNLPDGSDLGPEGYELDTTSGEVKIRANTAAGRFYAGQTLAQLRGDKVRITDRPRFPWRGLMLDPARHFLPISLLREQIDLLASLKMNRLHLHLTDDEGWRIEIKKYPALVKGEYQRSPGYYSADELRALVAYAKERHVTLVPEIDVPRHSIACVRAYPDLLCPNNPLRKPDGRYIYNEQNWAELCAGKEEVFRFLEHVFTEVAELFPGPHIHVGGDEIWGLAWAVCPLCQQRVTLENLSREDTPELRELHRAGLVGPTEKYLLYRYFMRRVCGLIRALGRHPIIWDDLAWRGDFPEGAVVEQWHYKGSMDFIQRIETPEDPAAEAARGGRDVVVSRYDWHYFDCESDNPDAIRKIYHLDPVPAELGSGDARRILGLQACLWDTPPGLIKSRLLPRLKAISEVGWTFPCNMDWPSFEGSICTLSPAA